LSGCGTRRSRADATIETSAQKLASETAIVLPKKPSDGLPSSPTRACARRVIGAAATPSASGEAEALVVQEM